MTLHFAKKVTVRIPYQAAPRLFSEDDRTGYNFGVYGLNCDVFDLPGLQVRAGYRTGGEAIPRELYADLDESAKDAPYEKRAALRLEFQDRVYRYLKERDKVYQSLVK